MHEFKVETVERDGAIIYRMQGVMGDAHQPHDFHEAFLASLPEAPARIVFNVERVENLYSSGIGILANCFTEAKSAGKSLILCCVPKHIEQLLTLTGVMPILRSTATEDEAVAAPVE